MIVPSRYLAALIGCTATLWVLGVASPPVSAQQEVESVNPRVQELIDDDQGVLLSLGNALGTAPSAVEIPETLESGISTEFEEPDATTTQSIVQSTEQPAQLEEDTQAAMAEGEQSTSTVEEDVVALSESEGGSVDEWPPPPEELAAGGFDEQPAAGVEIVKGTESEFAEVTSGEGDAAAEDEALPPAVEETTVAVTEVETVPIETAPEAEEAAPAAEETQTAMAVEEQAAATGDDTGGLDAGLVPLRTAELGNADSIGPYRLWLASYRTVRQAKEGWQELALAHQEVLGDLTPVIVLKDLGAEEGTFFRLQAGPLQTQASAVARCDQLKDVGLYCSVLGP